MHKNNVDQMFIYLSNLIGLPIVTQSEHAAVGRVSDFIVDSSMEPYPAVIGVVFADKKSKTERYFSWHDVISSNGELLVADSAMSDAVEVNLKGGEILLKETIMDKQVVDTDGAKVRRVNDLQFLKIGDKLYLIHVDVGFRGLMRRVGMEKMTLSVLQALFDYMLPDQFISWKFIQPLPSSNSTRLKITQERLARIHPADLADIIEDLDIHQRNAIFQVLDVETAAETLEETDLKVQVSLISEMQPEKASDIIEEMSLSDATDLIQDLPREKADVILKEMEKEFAEDVKELLDLPEEKAGGLMTPAIPEFAAGITAEEAIEKLRQGEELDLIYYSYIVNEAGNHLGVVSIRDLLLAPPSTLLQEIMDDRVIAVNINASKKEIMECFIKYALIAIPVVDDEEKLKGAVLFKDVIDIIEQEIEK